MCELGPGRHVTALDGTEDADEGFDDGLLEQGPSLHLPQGPAVQRGAYGDDAAAEPGPQVNDLGLHPDVRGGPEEEGGALVTSPVRQEETGAVGGSGT